MIWRIGNGNVVTEVSSVGAIVHKLFWLGNQIIAPYREIGEKMRGGIPICFPFFGSPPDEMKSFQKHGWLRHQELNLVDSSDSRVVFEGENEPSDEYPWRLKYKIMVAAYPDYLMMKLATTRLRDGNYFNAPINPGFHPYFCANPENLIAMCMARVGQDVITNFPKESEKILVDENILVRSGGKNVKMVLAGDFNHESFLTLWSDNNREYFCVEPILTHPEKFNGEGGKFLKEGETSQLIFQLVEL